MAQLTDKDREAARRYANDSDEDSVMDTADIYLDGILAERKRVAEYLKSQAGKTGDEAYDPDKGMCSDEANVQQGWHMAANSFAATVLRGPQ